MSQTQLKIQAIDTSFPTLGYVQTTTSQSSISTQTDLTGLSVTVTVPSGGRRIKITGFVTFLNTSSPSSVGLEIMEGATQLQEAVVQINTSALQATCIAEIITTPTAGSHTYKLQARNATGGGTASTNSGTSTPAFILVELI